MSRFKKNSKSQGQDKKGEEKGSSEQKSQIRLNKNYFEFLPQDEGENPFSPVSKSTSASLMDAGGATATACSTQPALVCPASESPQHEDEFVDSEGHKKQKGRFKWSIKTKKEVPENEREKHGKKKDKGKNKKGSTSSQEVEPQTATIQGVAPSPPTKGHSSDGSESHVLDSKQQDGHKQEPKRKLDLQSDDLLMATADDSQVFVGSNLGQLMVENETLKSQQEENDKIIAKLKEKQLRLAKELEQTKSNRKDVLQSEIALIQEKEASFKAQHEQLISDLEEAVQRKHAEVERLTGDHAKQVKAIEDDHSKKISQLRQEKQRSEGEKEEEARKLQQELQEKEKLNQEKEERLKLLRRESVLFKERADHLETKLKEREVEQDVCALPPDHHVDEMRKLREELDNKYEQEINQLKAALKEKEKREEESREEVDRFHQELEKANEKHSEVVRQLCELKQESKQELNRLCQELTEATEKYNEDVKRLESELEEKNEQDVEKLRKELEEANTTHTKDVQRLNSELKRKDEQHAKEITEMKTEYEDKYRAEMHQKDAEFQRKIKSQDAASNGLIRKLKNEVKGLSEKLKKDSESKDAVVTKLTKELEKTKQECQLKEHEKQQCMEAVKRNSERVQHDQKRQLGKEIETLKEKLHEASAKLIAVSEGKSKTGVVQRLSDQLQERDDELKYVVVEVEMLRGSFAKLTTDYEHLQHLHQQLMVEANLKKELALDSSCDDPCDNTVFDPQVKLKQCTRLSLRKQTDSQSDTECISSEISSPLAQTEKPEADPIYKQSRTTHLERRLDKILFDMQTIKSENEQLRDEVWKMKRADRPPGGAAVTSHSEVRGYNFGISVSHKHVHDAINTPFQPHKNMLAEDDSQKPLRRPLNINQESPPTACRERSRSPSPIAFVKPIFQNPKPQSPYRRQASVGPIMVHPSAQPVSPSLPHGHYFNQQQQQINFIENVKIREETLTTDNPQPVKHKLDFEDEDEEHDDRPFDPNLVCLTCKEQFRIGEIQEYRRHYKICRNRWNDKHPFQLDPVRQHNIMMAGDTQPFTPIFPSMEHESKMSEIMPEPKLLCRTPGCSFKGYEDLGGLCPDCSDQVNI